jgi:hypothetical protein
MDVRPYVMPITNRVRPRIGDVIEIPTPKGFAYAQFTHKPPQKYGALLRVLPGLFPQRPSDFAELVLQRPVFSTFFPLGAACNRGIVTVVASEAIPPHATALPIFRNSHVDRTGNQVGPWFLWDGKREWRVKSLSDQQLRDYPPLGIWNDTLLIERILAGWRHEDEV